VGAWCGKVEGGFAAAVPGTACGSVFPVGTGSSAPSGTSTRHLQSPLRPKVMHVTVERLADGEAGTGWEPAAARDGAAVEHRPTAAGCCWAVVSAWPPCP